MLKPIIEVRSSPIQGFGAFVLKRIPKGCRIIEYVGEVISTSEADHRYEDSLSDQPHVLLFSLDKHTVIDAGINGNDSRFINHSCQPNCEAIIKRKHIFIQSLRNITEGEELTYDYNLTREDQADAELEKRYVCNCGATDCRGTMLKPVKKKKRLHR